tara:strand:+ start:11 stop:553 length:543 start_codon:yes stop_codon:yes gene_type:complete
MTEPVIDIRDRIEKMRNQMTVPASKVSTTETKVENKKIESVSSDKAANINVANLEKKLDKSNFESANKENIRFEQKEKSAMDSEVQNLKPKKVEESDVNEKIEFEKRKTFENKKNYKTYDSYQNDRVVDEKKQSVKFDEKQSFPQFSLNVSNPISWKLMLLIMLMQLLTNMMLVVVLYLK